jgi:RNA polymerase sigma factor (sigma-70 family)
MPSDAELVARVCLEDDRHAFATLVRKYQSQVRQLLRRLTCGDSAWADDLAQETFLAAYKSLRSYRGDARLSSWLYRIAYNRWLDNTRLAEEKARRKSTNVVPDEPISSRDVTRAEARHDLEKLMVVLNNDERAALALTYGADATHEEAAAILGCPLGTLKSHVLVAKEKLRSELQQ